MMVKLTPPIKVNLEGDLNQIENLKEQWEKIPYAANSTEVAVQAKKTLALFKSPELSKPSILAALPDTAKDITTIQLIDNMFITAIEEYRSDFINATAKDFEISLQPRDTALDFHHALATGAARLAVKTPNIPIIKQIVGPLLSLIGGIYGIFNKKKLVAEKISEERSVNRTKWFEEVQVKEKQRIKKAMVLVNSRVKAIKQDIEAMDKALIDTNLTDELKLLNLLTNFISPETPIKVNNLLVLEYLNANGLN